MCYVNYRLCKLIQLCSNGDTEADALMFVFDFDKVAYQL